LFGHKGRKGRDEEGGGRKKKTTYGGFKGIDLGVGGVKREKTNVMAGRKSGKLENVREGIDDDGKL